MDKNKILTIGGIAGVILGATALYFAGTSEQNVFAIVGGVFVLCGVIMSALKK